MPRLFLLPCYHLLLFCCLGLQLTACSALRSIAGATGEEDLYLNAPYNFVIEHPADWELVKEPQAGSAIAHWHAPKMASATPAEVLIFVFKAESGIDRLEEKFLAANRNFVVTSRSPESLAGTEARQLNGSRSGRTVQVYLLSTPGSDFILEFSAPADDFESYRDVFREMAASFRLLD